MSTKHEFLSRVLAFNNILSLLQHNIDEFKFHFTVNKLHKMDTNA